MLEIDPYCTKYGTLYREEIIRELGLANLQTKQEAESIYSDLFGTWPSDEEADRTSIYYRVWSLLDKRKRPDI